MARGYAAGPPLGDGSCPGVTSFVLARGTAVAPAQLFKSAKPVDLSASAQLARRRLAFASPLQRLRHARRPSLWEGFPRGPHASRQSFEVAPSVAPSLMFIGRKCWAWFLGVAGTAGLTAGPLEGNPIPLQEYDSTLIDGGSTPCHPSPSLRAFSCVPKISRTCSPPFPSGRMPSRSPGFASKLRGRSSRAPLGEEGVHVPGLTALERERQPRPERPFQRTASVTRTGVPVAL